MDNNFCGTCGSKLENGMCPNCNKTEEVKVVKKEGSNFGWGVLGFFIPLVGLILFFVFKNSKKGASKASGIGALIGFIIQLIISFFLSAIFIFGWFSIPVLDNMAKRNITIEKGNTALILDYDIKDSLYDINWNDYYYEDMNKEVTYKAVDSKNRELFRIIRNNNNYVLVTNSNEKIDLGMLLLQRFNFFYIDDLLIFDAGNGTYDYYFYNLDSNKLVHAFDGTKGEYQGFYVKNISFDEDKNLVFDVKVDGLSLDTENSNRNGIALKLDLDRYTSLEELKKDLETYNLDNFVLTSTLKFKKVGKSYFDAPAIVSKGVLDVFVEEHPSESYTQIERTKDCVGKVTLNNHEALFEENKDKTCKTVTYKVNNDFTVKYVLTDANTYTNYDKYVNGVKIDEGIYPEFDAGWKYYVSGKTLVTHEWSTDLGADVYLVNTKGEKYNIKDNINQLNIEKMTEKGYKVDSDGSLVITGIRHSNQCSYGVNINGKCADKDFCDNTYEAYASKYSLPSNYDYSAEYTFEIGNDGLYGMNYSSKKSTKTLKVYHDEYCIQR